MQRPPIRKSGMQEIRFRNHRNQMPNNSTSNMFVSELVSNDNNNNNKNRKESLNNKELMMLVLFQFLNLNGFCNVFYFSNNIILKCTQFLIFTVGTLTNTPPKVWYLTRGRRAVKGEKFVLECIASGRYY